MSIDSEHRCFCRDPHLWFCEVLVCYYYYIHFFTSFAFLRKRATSFGQNISLGKSPKAYNIYYFWMRHNNDRAVESFFLRPHQFNFGFKFKAITTILLTHSCWPAWAPQATGGGLCASSELIHSWGFSLGLAPLFNWDVIIYCNAHVIYLSTAILPLPAAYVNLFLFCRLGQDVKLTEFHQTVCCYCFLEQGY